MKTIGVISDTHGLVRPEALNALRGTDLILHAGDIGAPEVLERLRLIADVVAIKGNNDRDGWARKIPDTLEVKPEGVGIYLIHNVRDLAIDPAAAGYRVVVSGHSHMPSIREESGVIYLNPGSAGPRRFKLPISVARLQIDRQSVRTEIISLDVSAAPKKSLTSRKPRHIKNSAF
ncbi:MAG TPA: metallophosphoesterase family protein [Candidatus Binatia bacterium]|nr:metallophosphoesterase family protein [Candidatus Binatia bacterium]